MHSTEKRAYRAHGHELSDLNPPGSRSAHAIQGAETHTPAELAERYDEATLQIAYDDGGHSAEERLIIRTALGLKGFDADGLMARPGSTRVGPGPVSRETTGLNDTPTPDPDLWVPGDVMEPLGMQWLLIGLAPGVEFISGHDTRDEANEAMKEHRGRTFDFYAVIKARDFYALP